MKGKLKAIWSDFLMLESYCPEKTDNFGLWVELSIGMENSNGADYFRIFTCTPEWLCKNQWVPELVRHMLIVRKYDLNEIKQTIINCIEKCEGNDWMEIAQKLSRYFAWEFEDYQP